jgi:hypothetical protein
MMLEGEISSKATNHQGITKEVTERSYSSTTMTTTVGYLGRVTTQCIKHSKVSAGLIIPALEEYSILLDSLSVTLDLKSKLVIREKYGRRRSNRVAIDLFYRCVQLWYPIQNGQLKYKVRETFTEKFEFER